MAQTLLSSPTTEATPELTIARSRRPLWVIGVAIVLLLAAFGGGILTGRAMVSDPVGLADDAVVELIDENARALNARDEAALAATYSEDAVVHDLIGGEEYTGADQIATTYASVPNWRLERTSELVQQGRFIAATFTYFRGAGVTIFQIEGDKIAHQWIIGT